MKNITISEYGYLGCDNVNTDNDKFVGDRSLTKSEFDEVYQYWLDNQETQKVFSFENKYCLKATSYVGVIETKSLSIEILPKIYKKENEDIDRNTFIEVLKPVLHIESLQIDKANISITHNKNILEIFISMFIDYMKTLIHKGLKSDYIDKEENQNFLKGKININKQIQKNFIHKERFYVEFDEYLQNRVENKLLKSTIQLLLNRTNDYNNKRDLRQQLFIFDQVDLSKNYKDDFRKVNLHRGMESYREPLKFAETFLMDNTFSSIRGKNNVFSLLFPMEKVFEEYMEYVLEESKHYLEIKNIRINGYSGDWFLSNKKCNMINLQPDYLLEMNNGKNIIADAKWKLFEVNENESKSCEKVNIVSSDVYQIFTYLNYYENVKETAYIFVPKTDEINQVINLEYETMQQHILNKSIKVIPINLNLLVNRFSVIDDKIFK